MSKLATIDTFEIIFSANFKKQYKKIVKQSKKVDKLFQVIDELAESVIWSRSYYYLQQEVIVNCLNKYKKCI